jgi:hypothetical protein
MAFGGPDGATIEETGFTCVVSDYLDLQPYELRVITNTSYQFIVYTAYSGYIEIQGTNFFISI